jgi:hypothetical protein
VHAVEPDVGYRNYDGSVGGNSSSGATGCAGLASSLLVREGQTPDVWRVAGELGLCTRWSLTSATGMMSVASAETVPPELPVVKAWRAAFWSARDRPRTSGELPENWGCARGGA